MSSFVCLISRANNLKFFVGHGLYIEAEEHGEENQPLSSRLWLVRDAASILDVVMKTVKPNELKPRCFQMP